MASTQNMTIKAKTREAGKHTARALRRTGEVPATIYGPKTKPLAVAITLQEAKRYGRQSFENTIFTVSSSDKALDGLKVMRKAMDIHPVSRMPIHIDFFAPDMTKSVRVDVELRFTGKALGVADGGVFNAVRREVEIECLPTEIPEFFEVDVTELGLNQSMHVSDVKFPAGVKVITSMGETIATCAIVEEVVAAPVAEAAAAPAEGAAAAGAAPAAGAAAAPGAAPAAGAAKGAAPAAGAKKEEKK